jgi:hypothetical protein
MCRGSAVGSQRGKRGKPVGKPVLSRLMLTRAGSTGRLARSCPGEARRQASLINSPGVSVPSPVRWLFSAPGRFVTWGLRGQPFRRRELRPLSCFSLQDPGSTGRQNAPHTVEAES